MGILNDLKLNTLGGRDGRSSPGQCRCWGLSLDREQCPPDITMKETEKAGGRRDWEKRRNSEKTLENWHNRRQAVWAETPTQTKAK